MLEKSAEKDGTNIDLITGLTIANMLKIGNKHLGRPESVFLH